jgi:transposase
MRWMHRIRLYPTESQEARLRHILHVTRHLYNAALQERRDAYRGRSISITAKCSMPNSRLYEPKTLALQACTANVKMLSCIGWSWVWRHFPTRQERRNAGLPEI